MDKTDEPRDRWLNSHRARPRHIPVVAPPQIFCITSFRPTKPLVWVQGLLPSRVVSSLRDLQLGEKVNPAAGPTTTTSSPTLEREQKNTKISRVRTLDTTPFTQIGEACIRSYAHEDSTDAERHRNSDFAFRKYLSTAREPTRWQLSVRPHLSWRLVLDGPTQVQVPFSAPLPPCRPLARALLG